MPVNEVEGLLGALRVSQDIARKRHRIRMFVLRCTLRGESYLRLVRCAGQPTPDKGT
jgi:hypothetical protein